MPPAPHLRNGRRVRKFPRWDAIPVLSGQRRNLMETPAVGIPAAPQWQTRGVRPGILLQIIGKGNGMLGWAIFFFLLAIVAAFFGFGGVAAIAVDAAKILFVVFVILFVLTLVVHLVREIGRASCRERVCQYV